MRDFDTQADEDTYYRTRFNAELTPEETFKYHNWLDEEGKKQGRDMRADATDYDMQGAWKSGAGAAGNGHFPDTFKKPNHPTFSDQSQYHGTPDELHGDAWQGGHWTEAEGKTSYTPSRKMLDTTMPESYMRSYMRDREPDVKLLLPE